jgi:N,N-dimethylformamidase
VDLLCAYSDRLSYRPGDEIRLFTSGAPGVAHISLVRLVRGCDSDINDEPSIEWTGEGDYSIERQESARGSFVRAELTSAPTRGVLSVGATIFMPRVVSEADQTVAWLSDDECDLRLVVRHGQLVAEARTPADHLSVVGGPLVEHRWLTVAATFHEDGIQLFLYGDERQDVHRASAGAPLRLPSTTTVCFGAVRPRAVTKTGNFYCGRADDHYNGKLASPFVAELMLSAEMVQRIHTEPRCLEAQSGELLGAWDLCLRRGGELSTATSLTAGADAEMVNMPARAVTGPRWDGSSVSFIDRPELYDAVHFHQDDVVDSGWSPTVVSELPVDLHSALYGLRIQHQGGAETVPIVVAPRAARSPITVVIPSFTYLAYGNEMLFDDLDQEALSEQTMSATAYELSRMAIPDFGKSVYDRHWDGSGVMFSSARRPILNMRHDKTMWLTGAPRHLSAEMLLIEWLTRKGFSFDVVSDVDLHLSGAEALAGTSVVITGSHPEYVSAQILDAFLAHRDGGGSIMYLGGNGFYWATGVLGEDPLVIEIRRGHSGIRTWDSLPGETHLLATGEPGGLWRHRGRPPNLLVGVGMAAQGLGSSEGYWRTEASRDASVSWIFDGVDEDPVGSYGLVSNGAAGDEIDRFDHVLGSPSQAVVLATSRNHTDFYQRAIEELGMSLPGRSGGRSDPQVHADMVYFRTSSGGQVFAVGSMAWTAALPHGNWDNGVSRITENVLRRLLVEEP